MSVNFWSINRCGYAGVLVILFILFSITSILMTSQRAHAQSAQCIALRGQLATLSALPSFSNKSAHQNYQKYNTLVIRQMTALKHARGDAAYRGCFTQSGKLSGWGAASCPALVSKISKMERNLANLKAKRGRFANTGSKPKNNRSARQKIRHKLARLNCSVEERTAKNSNGGRSTFDGSRIDNSAIRQQTGKRKKKRGLFARIFRTGRKKRVRFSNRDVLREAALVDEETLRLERERTGGVFRTLCVRVCDGYYFPVSFAVVRSAFDTDEAICQASNTSTEMRLFVHRNPSESSEDMVDLYGASYLDLPNAFSYRHQVSDPKVCPRISQPSRFSQLAGYALSDRVTAENNYTEVPFGPRGDGIIKPEVKPDFFNDPDTRMAIAGNFSIVAVNPSSEPVASNEGPVTYDPSKIAENGVRVVGPTFLGDQQSVKLLLAPDQTQVQ